MLRIQVRDMHGCKIGDGVFQIIVFVVYGHFSSVWNILAEFVLINQFIAPGALFAGSAGRSQGGVIIGSKVVYRAKHAIVEKAESGGETAVPGLAAGKGGLVRRIPRSWAGVRTAR